MWKVHFEKWVHYYSGTHAQVEEHTRKMAVVLIEPVYEGTQVGNLQGNFTEL